ncbi:hypothetical protein [Ideonella sp. BN130291]|uniref:hypothetical protein n=1 Tax=Ideonella sp. BN130291 TaxID=3112940 RepID=UPI002E267098|nr:hypothetical protein [Ideonella sp. BN130291]
MQARLGLGLSLSVIAAALLAACAGTPGASKDGMSFFVTSSGPGKGADLGGLEGADRQCQALATAAGAGNRTWRAYLSAQPEGGKPGVNARDRIGKGPWRNAKGDVIATDVENLHSANNINKQTALTERGATINGRGDTPNMHDVLTGSQPSGVFIAGNVDSTCRNWTSSTDGAAMVGHHDRTGLDESVPAKSWNSSHQSRGCSADALKATGGAGLFYCFAAD